MIKIIGAALIIIGSSGIGICVGQDMKNRLESLYLLRHMILLMQSEVKFHKATLQEACEVTALHIEGHLQQFLKAIVEKVKLQEGKSFFSIWKEECEQKLENMNLTKKDLTMLSDMMIKAGFSDYEMQLTAMDLYMEQVNIQIEKLKEILEKKCTVYRCFGIMSGILLVILLL